MKDLKILRLQLRMTKKVDRTTRYKIQALLVVIIMTGVLLVPMESAWAQRVPKEQGSGFLKTVTTGVGEVLTMAGGVSAANVLGVVAILAYFAMQAFSVLLGYVASWMDAVFWGTAALDPAVLTVVQVGWTTLRDMANAFFILLLLWIALTIIFNLEEWGGKKLLIRIFIVALLINFSLVIVTTVFGFTNALAWTFYEKMDPKKQGVAQFFIEKTRLHTITQLAKEGEIQKALQKIEELKKQANQTGNTGSNGQASAPGTASRTSSDRPAFSETLLAASGVPYAQATLAGIGVGAVGGCGLAALVTGAGILTANPLIAGAGGLSLKGCVIYAAAGGAVMLAWDALGKAALTQASQYAIYSGGGALLLGLAVYGFLMATVALLVRFIAEIFLSITAPLAFIAYLMPWGKAKGLFDKWLEALFKYAFFAPIFYFMIYMTLFMVQQFDTSIANPDIPIILNTDRILMVILVIVIMVIAVKFAKDSAGAAGEATITAGKVAGGALLGWGLGVAGTGVAAAARGLAPGLIKPAIQAISRTPILGVLAAPITRGTTRYLEGQEKKVEELKKKYTEYNTDNLVNEYHSSMLAKDKVAIAQVLAERGKLSELQKTGVNLENVVQMASGFGEQTKMGILKYNPLLARAEHFSTQELDQIKNRARDRGEGDITNEQAARRVTLDRAKVEDVSKMIVDFDELEKTDDPRLQGLIKDMLATLGPKHMAKIAQENMDMMQRIAAEVQKKPELTATMRDDTYKWLNTTTAKWAIGDLPTDHPPPRTELNQLSRERIPEKQQVLATRQNEANTLDRTITERGDDFGGRIKEQEAELKRLTEIKFKGPPLSMPYPKLNEAIETLEAGIKKLTAERDAELQKLNTERSALTAVITQITKEVDEMQKRMEELNKIRSLKR